MMIGNGIAEGVRIGEWPAGEAARPVLYVDGEMNLHDSISRAKALKIVSPGFRWLHHERYFEALQGTLNIAPPPIKRR